MKTQKELKEVFKNCMIDVWKDEHMQSYCMKQMAYIVELKEGEIIEIEKPQIKKDFCFGYGYCGCSSIEDYEDAADMAHHARTSERYFIKKNLEPLEHTIQQLQNSFTGEVFIYSRYYSQSEANPLRGYRFLRYGDELPEGARVIDREEVKNIIAGLEEVKKQFEKRLDTYLKRYGLSKVHSWTYLVD